jgi:hypothetical protein
MTLFPRLCLLLALAGATLGCQVAPPASAPEGVTPNAVAGDAIEVTALDAPAAAGASAATAPASLPTAPEQGAAQTPPTEAVVAEPAPVPTAEAVPAAEVATEVPAAEVEPPPPPKSERQIACERKRGNWIDTGKGSKICQFTTRDGGKSCTRESQCEGLCLARSRTCAPATPLLGCNEILQDDGSRATQCIE